MARSKITQAQARSPGIASFRAIVDKLDDQTCMTQGGGHKEHLDSRFHCEQCVAEAMQKVYQRGFLNGERVEKWRARSRT